MWNLLQVKKGGRPGTGSWTPLRSDREQPHLLRHARRERQGDRWGRRVARDVEPGGDLVDRVLDEAAVPVHELVPGRVEVQLPLLPRREDQA